MIFPEMSDRSVTISGVFGAGGNCRIEGTNELDWTNPVTLNCALTGLPLDLIAVGIELIAENVYMIRPHITAGDGTTLLTVNLLLSTSSHA